MKQEEAKQWVREGVSACLPPGCPLPFKNVLSARSVQKRVIATVELFDGQKGIVEVSQQAFGLACQGWCLSWLELPGGAINWNGRCWERVNKPPCPVQLELELTV